MSEDQQWVRVETEIPEPGKTRHFKIDDQRILLCNVDGDLFAVENSCTHARVLLTAGRLIGPELECPVHGARFDVRTGAVTCPPARKALRSFPVSLVEGGVEVQLD